MKKVGIIGGAGFIGSHITQKFLDSGFDVIVSTTDISNEDKYKHLMKLQNSDHLHISELDVVDKTTLKEFLDECDIVIHAGTPFQLDVQNPKSELFEPTINGTKQFLDLVKTATRIEKVIFVASVAAYNANFPLPPDGKTDTDIFDEDSQKFNSENCHPYGQAKFIANEIVEKFIAENPDLQTEISSVSPVLVMGKSLSERTDSTSIGLQFLIKNQIAPNPFVQMLYDRDVPFSIVDVRDVANAIYKLATTRNLHGENYLLSSETYKVSDIHRMLNNQNCAESAAITYKNNKSIRDFGATFRPVSQTLSEQ